MVPKLTVSMSFANILFMGVIQSLFVLLLVGVNIIPLSHISKVRFRRSK